MKIEFTKEQFKSLLELTYLGEWVANGHRMPDETISSYEDICSHLFAHAKDFGLQDCCIPHDPKDPDPNVYPTAEFEEEMQHYLEEQSQDVFWNELASGLASRDLIKQYGEKKLSQMDPEERFTKFLDLEEHYQEILSEKGIETLKLE